MAIMKIRVEYSRFMSTDITTDEFSKRHIFWHGWDVQSYRNGTITCHREKECDEGIYIWDAKYDRGILTCLESILTPDGRYPTVSKRIYNLQNHKKFTGTIGLNDEKGYLFFRNAEIESFMENYNISNFISTNPNIIYKMKDGLGTDIKLVSDGQPISVDSGDFKVIDASWVLILKKAKRHDGRLERKQILYSSKPLAYLSGDLAEVIKDPEYLDFIN